MLEPPFRPPPHSYPVAIARIQTFYVMNFARKQLEMMGWKEGKGLGKNEDGISKPLKLSVQKDCVGLGFDRNTSSINTEVWFQEIDQAIVKARKKSKRKAEEEEGRDMEEVSGQKYDNFVSSMGTKNDSKIGTNEVAAKEPKKKKKRKGIDLNQIYTKSNGITCHRSAHVGITMSGKMRRLQEQDEQFTLQSKS